jgi:Holliday junction resolvase RusA-like endonuclease
LVFGYGRFIRVNLMIDLTFEIPGDAVPKQSYRASKFGGYQPKSVTSYANLVKIMFMQKVKGFVPLTEFLDVTIEVYFIPPKSVAKSKKKMAMVLSGKLRPTARKDCDNIAKNILDSLNKIAYIDDRQVTKLTVIKRYGDIAKTIVRIKEDK